MARKASTHKPIKANQSRVIFDSIRKPGAPPGHPMTNAKPDAVARPAGRKAKHKRRPEVTVDEDL